MAKVADKGLLSPKGRQTGPLFPFFHLSPSSRYALSAASYLAQRPGRHCAIQDIARRQGLPRSFLVKVLRHLARCGITQVQRGPGGGYILARPPDRISLAEIVGAVEIPSAGPRSCLLELHGCATGSPCAIHQEVSRAEKNVWKALRAAKLTGCAMEKPAGGAE